MCDSLREKRKRRPRHARRELELLEMDPVAVYEEGSLVIDALAKKTAAVPTASPAAVR